jgi:peptidoglycan/LPS O-acetylase OafA/YrhL
MSVTVLDDVSAQPAVRPRDQSVAVGRLEALTGLRFFAAFCILSSHAAGWVAPFRDSDAIAHYGGALSLYGMPLFFVLSGFVINYNYGRLFETMRFRWAATEFIGARFARLYPLFICFFAVGLIVDVTFDWWRGHQWWWIRMVAHYATMTQSWFYMIIFDDRMIMSNAFGLAWSISTEFFFYICFLSFIVFFTRIKNWRLCLTVILVFSGCTLAFFIMAQAHRHGIENLAKAHIKNFVTVDQKWEDSFIRWLFYYSPYSRIFEFILGCLTARLYLLVVSKPIEPWEMSVARVAQALALAWLLLFGVANLLGDGSSVLGPYISFLALNFGCAVPIAVIIFCVSRYHTWLSTFFASAALVGLGEISYSIYVVHTWTLRIFIRDPVNFSLLFGLDAVFRITLAIALTLILSTATYRLIEMPGRRWLRQCSNGVLARCFGAREANIIGEEQSVAWRMVVSAGGLSLLLAACAIYQLLYRK